MACLQLQPHLKHKVAAPKHCCLGFAPDQGDSVEQCEELKTLAQQTV